MTTDDAQRILADAATAARTAGVSFLRCTSLIVMASHGRSGFARLLFGSEAGDVLSKSTVPVPICR